MRDGIKHVAGGINNRHDPIKLGTVSEENPVVTKLTVAQNVDIDDFNRVTTRDGRVLRYTGTTHSMFVDPDNAQVAYFVESGISEEIDSGFGANPVVLGAFANVFGASVSAGVNYILDIELTTLNTPPNNVIVTVFPGQQLEPTMITEGTYQIAFTPIADGTLRLNSIKGATLNVTLRAAVGSKLRQLNTDWTATDISTLNTDHDASFDSFNDEVVFTNTDQIGFIVDGALIDFAQVLLDDNEELMPAGQYLCFDHNDGSLLVAVDDQIYKSKPWNPMVYDKRYGQFPMNGYVRMLCTVEDGWWVGTDKNVSFVKRDGEDNFTFQHITDTPPIDGAFKKGYDFEEDKGFMYVVVEIKEQIV